MADWSFGVVVYIMGVLTGAVLTGWSPAFLERWRERERERERRRESREMIDLVRREAEKYDKARKAK
jgi:hypothetical protein